MKIILKSLQVGTGASLGSLIAAIKDNINHVIGLDLVPYADNYTLNKKLVDEIVPIKKYQKLNKEITFNVSNIIENDLSSRINYFIHGMKKMLFQMNILTLFIHIVF